MSSSAFSQEKNAYSALPPDIVQETLPFLSPSDIRNLSSTNRYFHKLLNYGSSETLWHELFHKAFGTPHTNDEPFLTKEVEDTRTCCEAIMTENFPGLSWQERFKVRTDQAQIYTWGCLKHARLGYTAASHGNIRESDLNNAGLRQLRFGVNRPTMVPWYPDEEGRGSKDACVVQISSGGFSFQILTQSGKLFSTGSTFTGGHKGPGVVEGEHDYNPFREAVHALESSFSRYRIPNRTATMTGTFPSHLGTVPTLGPHHNIYEDLEEMERKSTQTVPKNDHIRRMLTRDCFEIFTSDSGSLAVDEEKLDCIKYISVSSGRSHFLALDENNEIYSWDSPESDYGIRILFREFPSRSANPILKIGCGWDLNCVYIYKVGLVIWNKRTPCKKGESWSDAIYEVIPGTDELTGPKKIVDFACFQGDCVFYVTNESNRLWKYSNKLSVPQNIQLEGKIVKVSVCFTSLVIFTDQHCYTVNIKDDKLDVGSLKRLDLPDKEDCIISLACGDYHTIALTKKGQIYSWGLESQLCGCLGLGSTDDLIERDRVGRWDGIRNVRVTQPTKVKIDEGYVCVGVCAGGWQSGALVIKK
ncbi:hypothetical protein HG535_0C05080 [Zygotorulaspora mrakii]|uniref:F-box domain-containing protein n=1 Tax=Zygotorulaspora mrakii TaxID=42260 RepID=A0A7H9B193_ZYGMR|nr:uncharacterized protein HG535_0C05080 [Zygotorulaspora mrakii]QLG72154.1 hypothetical protein HG535_0C05080 [Zygotorulaspora mrakii]